VCGSLRVGSRRLIRCEIPEKKKRKKKRKKGKKIENHRLGAKTYLRGPVPLLFSEGKKRRRRGTLILAPFSIASSYRKKRKKKEKIKKME